MVRGAAAIVGVMVGGCFNPTGQGQDGGTTAASGSATTSGTTTGGAATSGSTEAPTTTAADRTSGETFPPGTEAMETTTTTSETTGGPPGPRPPAKLQMQGKIALAGAFAAVRATLDADAYDDLFVSSATLPGLATIHGGDALLVAPFVFPQASSSLSLAVGRWTNDPFDDVAAAAAARLDLAVTDMNGALTQLEPIVLAGCATPRWVVVEDLDGDAVLDVVVTCPEESRFIALRGLGGGVFAMPKAGELVRPPYAAALARVVGADEHPDLLLTSGAGGALDVLQGDGAGGFAPVATLMVEKAMNVAVGPVDGDDRDDVVVAQYSGTCSPFVAGSEGLEPLDEVICGAAPYHVVVADLNGDGLGDLLVADVIDDVVPGLLRVFTGVGGGVFSVTADEYGVDAQPRTIAVGNFSGDARPDVAVACQSGNVVVYTQVD